MSTSRRTGWGLVVVGAHRHRGLLGLGSETVEDALLHHTDLPVLIVPPEAEFPSEDGIQRILVPLGISERPHTILEPAVELAEATGGELILLHVMPTKSAVGIPVGHPPGREKIAEAYLEGIAERLRETSIVVQSRVVQQTTPVQAILDMIREERVDLIALTTDGHAGPEAGSPGQRVGKRPQGQPHTSVAGAPTGLGRALFA